MTTFKNSEGDELNFGVTEGGGAPMLVIKRDGVTTSYMFEDPQQVTDFIAVLSPYNAINQSIARGLM